MDDGDIIGPGKIRVFSYILVIVVMTLAIGEALAVGLGITFVRDISMFFAKRPGLLLGIAGIIAIGLLAIRAVNFFEDYDGQ